MNYSLGLEIDIFLYVYVFLYLCELWWASFDNPVKKWEKSYHFHLHKRDRQRPNNKLSNHYNTPVDSKLIRYIRQM